MENAKNSKCRCGGSVPKLAILAWEEGKVPRGLLQLETLKGNSTNPDTFDFPVLVERIPGACGKTVVQDPDPVVMQRMIDRARELESIGVRCITTSCGFNAIFQKEISSALKIPFFSSSLVQIPFIRAMYGNSRGIIVITARKANLKKEHFHATGTDDMSGLHIYGMREECEEWRKMGEDFNAELDLGLLRKQFVSIVLKAVREHPETVAIVYECTDMPPFSEVVRNATGLPVFDFVTMAEYVYSAVCQC